jgi:cobalamin synthase
MNQSSVVSLPASAIQSRVTKTRVLTAICCVAAILGAALLNAQGRFPAVYAVTTVAVLFAVFLFFGVRAERRLKGSK